jgi:hypothetical protein
MQFPQLLERAKIKGTQLIFDVESITDEELVEYMDWKATHKITTLRPSTLARLHARGLFESEIFKLFKNNKKIDYLATKTENKKVKTRT